MNRSFMDSSFKSFLDETGNIIDAPCSFILDEIKNDQIDYVGALFFTRMNSKDGDRKLNYYVKLPINIKKLINLGNDYAPGYALALDEQDLRQTVRMHSTKEFFETDKYYFRFSQDYRIENNIVNELSSSIAELTFKGIPTTIIIAKRKDYPLVIKIIATPFTVVADIILIPLAILAVIASN